MKKIILSLAFLYYFVHLSAQLAGGIENINLNSYANPVNKVIDTSQAYTWNKNVNIWDNNYLSLYYYNEDWNMRKRVGKKWDNSKYMWKNDIQVTLTYSGMKISEQLSQIWGTSNNDWVNQTLDTYTYDTDGNRISSLSQSWDSFLQEWLLSFRHTYTYDTSGNTTGDLEESWNTFTTMWQNSLLKTYSFDEQGNDTSFLIQQWNVPASSWINFTLSSFEYDSAQNQVESLLQYWDTIPEIWINNSINHFVYDTDGHLVEALGQVWDLSHQEWNNSSLKIYYYYDTGLVSDLTEKSWDAISLDWINKTYVHYENDEDGYKTSYITQVWDKSSETWIKSSKYRYTYIKVTYSIDELNTNQCTCTFQNPLLLPGTITCTGLPAHMACTLKLYSPAGQMVYQTKMTGKNRQVISNPLEDGMYILIIEAGNQVIYTDKLIIAGGY
jgi:hypothetical protein